MTAAEWIARARAVTDGATPGPWETFESSSLSADCLGVNAPEDTGMDMVLWHHEHGIVGGLAADAAFIAASRTMLPAAVAAIEAVLALVEETRLPAPDNSLLGGRVSATRLYAVIAAALDAS